MSPAGTLVDTGILRMYISCGILTKSYIVSGRVGGCYVIPGLRRA